MATATINAPVSTAPASHDEAAILAVVETMRRANHDENAAEFAAQFVPDAVIYNLAPPLVHHGVDVTEKQAWLDSWSTPVDIDARHLQVTVSGDFAFCHGYLRMTGTKKGAPGAVSFWMRETLCLERKGSDWQIVHEHTSVPFYMDGTLHPAFDLEPEN
jgi:ketosteroid isomerase-like protein